MTKTFEEYMYESGMKGVSDITKTVLEFHSKHPIKELSDFAAQSVREYKEKLTLFLKDSVLFISIDSKEYQVSNPEAFEGAWVPLGVTLKEYFKSFEGTGHPEWPGNVNIVHQIKDSTGWVTTHELMYSKFPDDRRRIVARLLPKEKKGRDHSVDLIAYMLGGIPDKGQLTSSEGDQQQFETAGTVTSLEPKTIVTIKTVESDYKQFEPKEVCVSKTCGDHTDHHRGEGRCEAKVESSEPQEKRMVCDKCNQPINWKIELTDNDGQVIPAPVESQEDLWEEVLKYCDQHFINDIRVKEYLSRRFSLTRNPLNQ